MFIAHGDKLRKNMKWIMGLFAVAVSFGLITLFTQTGNDGRRSVAGLPTIGGKPVNSAEYQDVRNGILQWAILTTGRVPQRGPEVEDRITQEAVVSLLLARKAKELGVHVTDAEVRQAIESQPILINESGQFDPDRYRRFTIYMNNYGITDVRYEQLVREQIARERLQELVTASVTATPQEVDLIYTPLHEKVTIEIAEFNVADYTEPVAVSNEEAEVFYEQNVETYRTPAQVKVRYALFSLADAQKTVKLTDEEIAEYYERNKTQLAGTNAVPPTLEEAKGEVEKDLIEIRAQRAAEDRAREFSIRLVPDRGAKPPVFDDICKEFGVQPVTTEFFAQAGKPLGATGSVAFVQQAFALDAETPTSDAVPGPEGYYVLEFLEAKPSVVPSFGEVKERIIDQITQIKIYNATVVRGQDTVDELRKLVADGKTFAEACAALKLKLERLPSFHIADEKLKLPANQRMQSEVLGMPVGAFSGFIPTATGGLVFHLVDRQPPDPALAESDKPLWRRRILQQNRQALFQSWLNALVREEQVDFGRLRTRPVTEEPAS